MSDLEDMLIFQEGTGPRKDTRFFPYVDTAGKTTIGYGHNLDAKGISETIAKMLFAEDIGDAIDDVLHNCSCYDQLSRPRQLVMVSLAFNLGRDGLAKFVRFLGAVHLSQWDKAADELLDSKAAREDPYRYKPLADMMRTSMSQWT